MSSWIAANLLPWPYGALPNRHDISPCGALLHGLNAVATLTSRDASTVNQSLSNTLTLQDAARLQADLRFAYCIFYLAR